MVRCQGWFTDNTPERFRSYGWHVIEAVDAYDPEAVSEAIRSARRQTQQPTLICCKTTIGYGSPNKAGTADAHGCLSAEETRLTREHLGYELPPFEVSEDMYRTGMLDGLVNRVNKIGMKSGRPTKRAIVKAVVL